MVHCQLSGYLPLVHFFCLHADVDFSSTIIHGKMDDYRDSQYLIYRPCSTSHRKGVFHTVTYIPPSFSTLMDVPGVTSDYTHLQGRLIDTIPPPLCFHIFRARDVLVRSLLFSNINGRYIRGSCLWSIPSGCMQHRSIILAILVVWKNVCFSLLGYAVQLCLR